ncbi:hypothetical protein PIROE2DRAFT_15767 [Piromyces sp. E2]|nr:hypothetical protein PIROE2DRAFT_15767 [Piromyces sp. E2]|eukprot:OUM58867.1 hypothetical protein PIROE2DRAFT_15767 [Piromyces sp. E2]
MIKEFFEKPNNRNNNEIDTTFDGLEISKDRKNMREFHRYPVITLNLKKDRTEDYESTIKSLKTIISNLFKYHRKDIDFNKLDSNEKRKWSQIENEVEDVQLLEGSIKFLMGLTGCISISFNKSLFSSSVNFVDCSLYYNPCFSDCYGFTEEEVDKLLSDFNCSHINKNNIQKKNIMDIFVVLTITTAYILGRYDYVFEIKFLSLLYGIPIIEEIGKYLDLNSKYYRYNDLWTLLLNYGYITIIDREEYTKSVDLIDDKITKLLLNIPEKEKYPNSIQNYKDDLKKGICSDRMSYIKVPNEEVLENFSTLLESSVSSLLGRENNKVVESYIKNFNEGIVEKDINKINNNLKDYLMIFCSYHLFKNYSTYENIYKILLMQLFIFWKTNGLIVEEDSGLGRYDIGFPNRKKYDEYILIEFKVYKTDIKENNIKKKKKNNKNDEKNKDEIENYLHKECNNAIKQIEEKKYESKPKMNLYNNFIKYGIAFYKKNCRVEMKINENEIQNPSKNNNNNNNNNNNR